MTGFNSKRDAAADKAQEPWNQDEWRKNNWRCQHGWLRGEQCEICNAAQPAQERQWIWLSDADIRETIDSICQYNGDYDEFLCKKIERKIKELNT
jgi:hypothetical protein